MAWSKEHKARTRQHIVEVAAAAFRQRGLGGVGVAEVMGEAGLTHGGFYAHFGSKDELAAEALRAAVAQTRGWLVAASAGAAPGERLQSVADAYLTPAHAAHPERGCSLATLGEEAVRERGPVRAALAEAIDRRIDWLQSLAPAESQTDRDWQATGALAAMVGGMILARGQRSPEKRDAILAQVRRFIGAALAAQDAFPRPARQAGPAGRATVRRPARRRPR
jgi:TetR/AcrR family transcriptional repressor of nem operon